MRFLHYIRQKFTRLTDSEFVFIFVLSVVLILQHAWLPGMFLDGLIYSVLGKNAAELGYWLVPHWNEGAMSQFFEHPPTFFIYLGLVFKLFGASWLTSRLAVYLIVVLILLSLWFFFQRLKLAKIGYASCLILLMSYPFIKKARFPLLDMPLALFGLLSLMFYYLALNSNKKRHWLFLSLAWGGALLTKGHAAFFIPLGIFIHLLLTRNTQYFFSFRLWAAFFSGMLLFLIWPFSLWLAGDIQIFYSWFDRQFVTTLIKALGKETWDLFLYLKILITQCLPWVLLASWGTYCLFKREKKDHWGFVVFSFFISALFLFSLAKWKYSHYILPIYPLLAILAALGFSFLNEKYFYGFVKASKSICLLLTLILLVFPLTIKSERDSALVGLSNFLKDSKIEITHYVDIDDAYDFDRMAAFFSFVSNGKTYRYYESDLVRLISGEDKKIKDIDMPLLFIKSHSVLINNGFKLKFKKIASIEHENIDIYIRDNQNVTLDGVIRLH